MRQIGLAMALLAAIPAVALPLFACIAMATVPVTVIAGVAAIAMPVPAGHDGGSDGQSARHATAPGWFIAR